MLSEIDVVVKSLQTRGRKLSECMDDIEVLMDSVEQDKTKIGSPLFQYKLKFRHVREQSAFEKAGIKTQRGQESKLTRVERDAAKILRKSAVQNKTVIPHRPIGNKQSSMSERLAKRRRILRAERTYMNCDFVLGSTAHVERLFSVAKYVLPENRRRISPELFETIVFLKENADLWDATLFVRALQNGRGEISREGNLSPMVSESEIELNLGN